MSLTTPNTVTRPKQSPAAATSGERGVWALLALVALGLLTEAIWIRFFLRPFSLVRLDGPQLAPEPFVPALDSGPAGLATFVLSVALLFALYGAALALARVAAHRRLLLVAAAFGVVFALTLWPAIALGSTDLYHYILDGRALAYHGGNPLSTPPDAFWSDRLSHILFYNTENTGAYGPLFYTLAAVAAVLGRHDLVWSTLTMKGLALIWFFGCLPLLHGIGERIQPGRGALAVLAFAWNPLILFEVAGSGHNDIGVAFFGLLACWFALSGRWQWAPAALALGVLVKPTALLLLPALLLWIPVRERGMPRSLLVWPFVAAAGIVVAGYIPFWAGTETFSQLRHLATLRMNSPADLAVVLLGTRLDPEEAAHRVKLVAGVAFLLAAGVVLLRVRDARAFTLVSAWFWCLFAYLMLASWWFWPWYLIPLIAFGALLWNGRAAAVTFAFSCSALLLYAALGWREILFTHTDVASQAFGVGLLVFLPPALVWATSWFYGPVREPER
jgi:hypothetical protein